MSSGAKSFTKRSHIRFSLEDSSVAQIKFKDQIQEKVLFALVVNESYTGCCLVANETISEGADIHIKVGNLDYIPATIIWINKLDDSVYKYGFEFTK
ncbi:hypothetical protein N9N67_10365 [Bacteriovoracaceae bacterium]|nr:hypothetical protein [Bacteriovoracaceae bacterium]